MKRSHRLFVIMLFALLSACGAGETNEQQFIKFKVLDHSQISGITFTPGPGSGPGQPRMATLNLEEHEKAVISQALREEHGNVSAAAKALGINRSTLYQKMKKYGI